MAEKISLEDQIQLFKSNLVLYKNALVYVTSIPGDCIFNIFDLKSQRSERVEFDLDDFKPPMRRIGFVNVDGGVVYVARTSARKMQIGINLGNSVFKMIDSTYPEGVGNTQARVKTLKTPEVLDAYLNKYPTFKEALDSAKEYNGSFAFDKQFAVDYKRNVFYKGDCVGEVGKNVTSSDKISFLPGNEYLVNVIGTNYEKTLSIA